MSFELGRFGIRVKTVAPGGIKTDFLGRSLDLGQHSAYAEDMQKMLAAFTAPKRLDEHSTAEEIAEVVYGAATDDDDRVAYIAGKDAVAYLGQRQAAGTEAFRRGIRQMIFGG